MNRKQIIRGVMFSLMLNAALPYFVFRLLLGQLSSIMALTVATLIPLLETLIYFIKHRKWDVFGLFMFVSFILGIIAALIGGNERLILVRESFVTGIMGVIFLGSLLAPRPLIYHFALRFTVGKTAEEQTSFKDNWNIPYVRKLIRILTLGWGISLLADATLKVVLVYALTPSVFLALSGFLTYGVIGITIVWTVLYRRKSRQILANPDTVRTHRIDL